MERIPLDKCSGIEVASRTTRISVAIELAIHEKPGQVYMEGTACNRAIVMVIYNLLCLSYILRTHTNN